MLLLNAVTRHGRRVVDAGGICPAATFAIVVDKSARQGRSLSSNGTFGIVVPGVEAASQGPTRSAASVDVMRINLTFTASGGAGPELGLLPD